MTPEKEKAIELVSEFEPYVITYTQDDVVGYLSEKTPIFEYQKQCAVITVNELIKETGKKWWYDVKSEIKKL
jgi:hypothetical protein